MDSLENTFVITHTPLAIALRAAGLRLVKMAIHYSESYLRRHGYASIAEARAGGLEPQTGFLFAKGPNHEAFLKAWNDASEKVKEGKSIDVPALTPVDFVTIACAVLTYRKAMFDGMKAMKAGLVIDESSPWIKILGADCPPDTFSK